MTITTPNDISTGSRIARKPQTINRMLRTIENPDTRFTSFPSVSGAPSGKTGDEDIRATSPLLLRLMLRGAPGTRTLAKLIVEVQWTALLMTVRFDRRMPFADCVHASPARHDTSISQNTVFNPRRWNPLTT